MTELRNRLEFIGSVYKQLLALHPYNSAYAVYSHLGLVSPPKYGAGCIGQSVRLGALLESEGFEVKYLLDGRHLAVLLRLQDHYCYLDPYLMHMEPMLFKVNPYGPHGVETVTQAAYPNNSRVSSRLTATYSATGTLTIEKVRRQFDVPSQRHRFRFNISESQEKPLVSYRTKSIVFSPERTSVSLRVLDIEAGSPIHIVIRLKSIDGKISPGDLFYRDLNGAYIFTGEAQIERPRVVLERLGYHYDEVEAYLMRAARLYAEHCPNGMRLTSENAENA